ncbi:S41 family peptidase [Caulobacter sp. NIBR2454]|uniref:S41 family peptidase n=1 Tax=Caulobacter sp. NIBR2454 TaxID=3015996 RepID=UPI0022B70C64|nr:S41 family peptidase [Caulobacter sp. NIBR2454]
MLVRHAAVLAATLVICSNAQAAAPLDKRQAAQVLDRLDTALNRYVFPEKAKAVQAALKNKRETLLAAADLDAFLLAVSEEMRATGADQHFNLRYEPPVAGAITPNGPPPRLWTEPVAKGQAQGLMALRRLPGNIGYIKLRYFMDTPEAVAMIDSALTLVKDTDGLIIDLRENGGGGGGADEQLLGHLSHTPIPTVEVRWRQPDGSWEVMQRNAAKPAGGPLFADKPVYVLTSAKTFSAAEAFTYALKAAGRATLVGETTRGGANPSNGMAQLGDGFTAFIPNGLVVHPTTKTNWEGVGIAPDVATPVGEALTKAYELALKAAKPTIRFKALDDQRAKALADPKAALASDQLL